MPSIPQLLVAFLWKGEISMPFTKCNLLQSHHLCYNLQSIVICMVEYNIYKLHEKLTLWWRVIKPGSDTWVRFIWFILEVEVKGATPWATGNMVLFALRSGAHQLETNENRLWKPIQPKTTNHKNGLENALGIWGTTRRLAPQRTFANGACDAAKFRLRRSKKEVSK